jgi:hypothetical protein
MKVLQTTILEKVRAIYAILHLLGKGFKYTYNSSGCHCCIYAEDLMQDSHASHCNRKKLLRLRRSGTNPTAPTCKKRC